MGGYSVEVSDKDRRKAIWDVVDDHVVGQGVEHEELGLRGFDYNLFDEEREGYVGGDVKQLSYLLMLMNLWNGDWQGQLYQMNKKVDEDNRRGGTQQNGPFWKLRQFSRNKLWKNVGCLLSAPTFDIGGSRLWKKDPEIIRKKRKRSSI